LYQGRLGHLWQEELQDKEPEEIFDKDENLISLYESLQEKVCQSDRPAKRRASTGRLQPGTKDEEEEEEGQWKVVERKKKKKMKKKRNQ
jgi:hypothetical protein